MKVDLSNLNPGVQFFFNDDKEEEGGMVLRGMTSEILDIIDKTCIKTEVKFKRGQRYEVKNENKTKRSTMMWDYIIVSWSNITGMDDVEIPCTTENKLKLVQGNTTIANFVADCIEKLAEDSENMTEMLEKNSSA